MAHTPHGRLTRYRLWRASLMGPDGHAPSVAQAG
jgi:hypothetical protein